MYGFGNWDGVAEHVGTKSKLQCLNHYNAMYMNSPCFPLPVRLLDQLAFVVLFYTIHNQSSETENENSIVYSI